MLKMGHGQTINTSQVTGLIHLENQAIFLEGAYHILC